MGASGRFGFDPVIPGFDAAKIIAARYAGVAKAGRREKDKVNACIISGFLGREMLREDFHRRFPRHFLACCQERREDSIPRLVSRPRVLSLRQNVSCTCMGCWSSTPRLSGQTGASLSFDGTLSISRAKSTLILSFVFKNVKLE
jgi:hypothetical protein